MIKNIFRKIKYELQFNNTQYYTRITEKVFKKKYRRILQNKIHALKPIPLSGTGNKLTLAMLANKKNLYESLATLYSFCFWDNCINVHYHEDGTLTDQDITIIEKLFPGIIIYRKVEQTQKVNDALMTKGLTNCIELRSHFLFSIRLFDMLLEKKTPYLLQIDSDVLFFSKPQEIFDIIDQGKLNGCYNQDDGDHYTFAPDIIAKYVSTNMLSKINAGLFMHNFDDTFFDFANNIIQKEPQAALSWHLEQTLFAMYASVKGDFLALPKQYDIMRKERNLGNKLISEHYCHNTGYDFHKDFIYKLFPLYTA
jgi:uncharacterized protein (UPF0248 family)